VRLGAFWLQPGAKARRAFTDLYPLGMLDSPALATIVASRGFAHDKERSMGTDKVVARAVSGAPMRRLQLVLVGMAMTLLAAVSLAAWAQPGPPPGMDDRGASGMRHGGHGMHGMHERMHGMHGGGGMMMFRGSPERMARNIDRMLDGLNASDAQRSQIKQIAIAVAGDLRAQAQAGRGLRERAMQAFTAPNVDAAAIEQVRQQMLQQHDQMSRRMSQAMLDVARVLTPEQRARLGERMRDRQARMEDRMKRMEQRMQSAPGAMQPRR
jgi:Spy/CpxP family protein refolding chaperone